MPLHRRQFIRWSALTAAWTAAGFPRSRLSAASAAPAIRESVRLVFFTDVHAREDERASENIAADLRKAAARINAAQPDVLIGGGDFIHGGYVVSEPKGEARFQVFMKDFYRQLDQRPFLMIGNHDHVAATPTDGSPAATNPKKAFRRRFGLERTYQHFRYKGIDFILLDSIRFDNVPPDLGRQYWGEIDPQQLAWLDATLADIPPENPIVLCSHIPFESQQIQLLKLAQQPVPASLAVPNADAVLARFAGRPNPVLVLEGHLHRNEDLRVRDVRYIMGGAVCGAWWQGPRDGTEEGFGLLTFSPEGIAYEYVDAGLARTGTSPY
ncbi:MAG: metallophosphoesterase family protein [Opitutales bacterium]